MWRCISFLNGGGFGRRLSQDLCSWSCIYFQSCWQTGKTYMDKRRWYTTRTISPDDFSSMKGGLSSDGKPVAFQHKVISTITRRFKKHKWFSCLAIIILVTDSFHHTSSVWIVKFGFLEAPSDGEIYFMLKGNRFTIWRKSSFHRRKSHRRNGPCCISSSLVHISFTGLPTALEIDAASTAKSCESLLPKPPPLKKICTFTLSFRNIKCSCQLLLTREVLVRKPKSPQYLLHAIALYNS